MKKTNVERVELMNAMHTVVMDCNNEDAYMRWIYLVPDGADEDDLIEIALDDEMFKDACRLFRELINEYGKDGFYVSGRVF